MTGAAVDTCLACGAREWTRFPDPGPQSMTSDLRVVSEPLNKRGCCRCQLGVRTAAAGAAATTLYAEGYTLYAHAPGRSFERTRQQHYAAWIRSAVGTAPRRVLDVGCGNGSLLLALGDIWPDAELLGCDASAESVAAGRAAGLRVWEATADLLPALDADLVVSVNVIEHTADPLRFIADLHRAGRPAASIAVVSPDATQPGVELLIADHLLSLAPSHLAHFCSAAGLGVRVVPPPAALKAFQMAVGEAGGPEARVQRPPATLNQARVDFLQRWGALDLDLLPRLPEAVTVFGVGEAAGLLRAYAPRAWDRVRTCTADVPVSGSFGDIPFVPLETLSPDAAILVAVQPADQPAVAGRLLTRFTNVITWHDLVAAPESV